MEEAHEPWEVVAVVDDLVVRDSCFRTREERNRETAKVIMEPITAPVTTKVVDADRWGEEDDIRRGHFVLPFSHRSTAHHNASCLLLSSVEHSRLR